MKTFIAFFLILVQKKAHLYQYSFQPPHINCFLTHLYLLKNNSVAKAMQPFFAAINLKTIQFIYTTFKIEFGITPWP
jgi:hypothetical protein